MLSKLIGYEMKAFGRILFPVYLAIVVVAVLLGIDFRLFSAPEGAAGSVALTIILVLLIAAVFLITIILSVGRFYTNLLGREGYLMFSLPTGTGSLIWAKVISSVIWSLFSVIVAAASVIPFFLIPSFSEEVEKIEISSIVSRVFEAAAPYTATIVLGVLIVIASTVAAIVRIYAAISIGHLWSDHRIIGAVLTYIGFEILELIIMAILGSGLFITDNLPDIYRAIGSIGAEVSVLLGCIVIIAIYSVVTWIVLDRKLNLE